MTEAAAALRRGRLGCSLFLLAIMLNACGTSARPPLEVSAAASLRAAFTEYGRQLHGAPPSFSFAGSNVLAAQIEQGLRPDVFASADAQLPEMLFSKGLTGRPVLIAANRIVVAVAARSPFRKLADVERRGVSVAVGSPGVPIGAYTASAIGRLPSEQRTRLLANVRDREPDVSGILGKLIEGAVDAGFVYATDVTASGGRLRAIELPVAIRPTVAYAAAIVRGARHAALARAFIDGLLHGAGRAALRRAGFVAVPGR